MTQQLNLYGASFKSPHILLSASNALRGLAVVVAICMLMGGFLAWRTNMSLVDTKEQQTYAQHRAKVGALQAQVTAQRQEVDMEAAKLNAVEQALARVKTILQGGVGDGAVSYAAYFEALAKQSHGSLWLTGFVISPDGQSIELKGRMLDASALPDYLSRLNAEPVFKGRQFAQLQVTSLASEGAETTAPKITEFVLRTASAQESKEPAR